jgi:hypothetical protein
VYVVWCDWMRRERERGRKGMLLYDDDDDDEYWMTL